MLENLEARVHEAYPMSVRGSLQGPSEVPVVISDLYNDDERDPNIPRKEKTALSKLKAKDIEYRELYFPELISWARKSEYYGQYLQYDPSRLILYIVADTEGSDLEKAVMFSIPHAELVTPDRRRHKVSILGSPLDYEKKVKELMRETQQPKHNVERYVFDHEYVHIFSTMSLLSRGTYFVEGTTDMILLDFYSQKAEEAEQKANAAKNSKIRDVYLSEKTEYETLRDIAEQRVETMKLTGRIASDVKQEAAPSHKTYTGLASLISSLFTH